MHYSHQKAETDMEPKGINVQSTSATGDDVAEDANVSKECSDDFGLRRRMVSPSEESSSIGRTTIAGDAQPDDIRELYGIHSESIDKFKGAPRRSNQHGTASRTVIQDDLKERNLPQKSKKSRESKYSYTPLAYLRKTPSYAGEFSSRHTAPKKSNITVVLKKGWTTADTLQEEPQAQILYMMRDFILFIIFLALVCGVTFGGQEQAFNFYASQIKEFISKGNFTTPMGTYRIESNFYQIYAIKQIWSYINQIVIPARALAASVKSENWVVGSPTIRQIRVKNNTCSTAPMFEDIYVTCYDYYTGSNEEKEPFGNRNSYVWQYTPEVHSMPSPGDVGYYGGGGYTFNVTSDYKFNVMWMKELENLSWIGLGTRAIIVDVVLFTPNTNLFLVIKLMFEILPTGGVKAKSYFTPLKLLKYLTHWDLFTMSCEFMVILFTFYYTFEELQQIWILREEYLTNWWNILDLTIIFLSYCTIFTGIRSFYMARTRLQQKVELMNTDSHVDFDDLLEAEAMFTMSRSFLTYAASIKLFKFTTLYKSVDLIISALGEIRGELIMAIFMSFILVSGFAICGMCLFGAHVEHFRAFSKASFSLISVYAGYLGFYDKCRKAYPILAPIYFGVYILLAAVFICALYVALIVYGYYCADVTMQQRSDNQYFGDLVWAFFIEILMFFRKFKLIEKLEQRETLSQNQKDYDAFVRVLKRQGCRGMELELFMRKYDMERGQDMDLEKMSDAYNEFFLRNMLFMEVEGHNEIYDHLDKVDKMFEFCEQTMVDIMTKIDYLSNFLLLGQQNAV